MAEKVWCWEAKYDRHGPDWRLVVHVAPESELHLDRIAVGSVLAGYAYCGAEEAPCALHQQTCHTHTWVDTTSAPAYLSNIEGSRQTNLWVYNIVQVHRDVVEVECGYGGRGDGHDEVTTAFLLALFDAPGVTVRSWHVLAGGNGYDFRTLGEGEGADTFRAYIGAR